MILDFFTNYTPFSWSVFYPFTAPCVIPSTIYFCAKANNTRVGMTERTVAADIAPQSISNLEINEFIATGIVFEPSSSINMTAKNSSFQHWTKAKIKVAVIPGSITGMMTLKSALNLEHPSIMAASSNVAGIRSKNPFMIMVQNGIIMTV